MSLFQQFYVDPKSVQSDVFTLNGDEAFHAFKVLRHKIGDFLNATDGMGNRYSGKILEITKEDVLVKINNVEINFGEPQHYLILAQAVPKGSLFDVVVEKGTEIGICEFQPILSKYSQINPENRINRWQQKAHAAMKQCGRSRCPKINVPVLFNDFVSSIKKENVFIAHEKTTVSLDKASFNSPKKSIVLIGPEGGFADEEIELAKAHNIIPISLGNRRLRSETAGIVAATKILHLTGDLG